MNGNGDGDGDGNRGIRSFAKLTSSPMRATFSPRTIKSPISISENFFSTISRLKASFSTTLQN